MTRPDPLEPPSPPFSHHLHSSYSSSATIRSWMEENVQISPSSLVYPIFIAPDPDAFLDLSPALPNQWAIGINRLEAYLQPLIDAGLANVLLFGSGSFRDSQGTCADSPSHSPVIKAIRLLKEKFPHLVLICDVCLCAYETDGHCGIVVVSPGEKGNEESQYIGEKVSDYIGTDRPINDYIGTDHLSIGTDNLSISTINAHTQPRIDAYATLKRIGEISLAYAQAGADIIAPSDMQDCRICEVKRALFQGGFGERVPVMSYSAKFCSCFYGPFRTAVIKAAESGKKASSHHSSIIIPSRHSSQLPVGSLKLAMRAMKRDVEEGADILMVKPAGFYGDIVREAKNAFPYHPIAAFQVSGEYAMLYWGAEKGAFGKREAVIESLKSMLRAGATILVTYFTRQILLEEW